MRRGNEDTDGESAYERREHAVGLWSWIGNEKTLPLLSAVQRVDALQEQQHPQSVKPHTDG